MAPVAFNKNLKLQQLFTVPLDFPGSGFAAAVPSTGLITCVSDANMADSDYVTVPDGIGAPVLYEYDKSANGVTSGRTAWAKGAASASDCATTLAAAINATQKTLTAVANGVDGAGTVRVTHNWPGVGGNATITENVANAGFLVTGLAGGLAAVATAITATTVAKFFKALAALEVVKAEIISPIGLVADAANYYTITVKNGATVMATWSTLTGQEGSLTANTFKTMTPAAAIDDRRAAAGDVLSLALTLTGAQTLPAGRVVLHCRYRGAIA